MDDGNKVPGQVVQDILLEPAACCTVEPRRGDVVRIVDVEGQQVADVICFNRHNLGEKLSNHYTKRLHNRWRIGEGDVLLSDDANDMLRIVRDTNRIHFLSGAMCSAEIDVRRYGAPGKRGNCRQGLAKVVAPYGIGIHDLPGALCTFMNVTYNPDGTMDTLPPTSRAGDYIDMQAEMDLLMAISNCPQEVNACNGHNLTSLRVIHYRPGS